LPEQRLSAAARLVGCPEGGSAARRFLDAAPATGIDPSLIWVTGSSDGRIRQVCLAVLGSGRTAMLFLSGPDPSTGDEQTQQAERAACVRAAGAYLDTETDAELMQALPSPGEFWAISAFRAGGLVELAELAYLRRVYRSPDRKAAPAVLANGIEIGSIASLGGLEATRNDLISALEKSYEQTMDCPALCGMRDTSDVLESHMGVGEWDPALWWLVRRNGSPEACLLLNHCPELDSIELVYVGLSPAVRGLGLAHKLMCVGIAETHSLGAHEMTCAVDRANAPALKLYTALGFETFADRTAMVGTPGEVAQSR